MMSDRIDHAAVSEDYHLTPETLDELQRLLDEYPKAVGFQDVTEAWFRLARAAIEALPDLLAATDELAHMREARDNARTEVERLTAKVERVRGLHYAADNDVTRPPSCETCHGKAGVHECGCWASEDLQPVCGHCNEGGKGVSVAWPCPTIRILDGGVES